MIPYTIAPLAQNDLDGIWSYIARDSLAAADRLLAVFHQKFVLLSSQPLIGEERPELAANLRSFSAGNYVVFYRPVRNGIAVVRVIHAARDIGSQF
jgi:toxin ParE1/3/4